MREREQAAGDAAPGQDEEEIWRRLEELELEEELEEHLQQGGEGDDDSEEESEVRKIKILDHSISDL